jgi:hypothetical protein
MLKSWLIFIFFSNMQITEIMETFIQKILALQGHYIVVQMGMLHCVLSGT